MIQQSGYFQIAPTEGRVSHLESQQAAGSRAAPFTRAVLALLALAIFINYVDRGASDQGRAEAIQRPIWFVGFRLFLGLCAGSDHRSVARPEDQRISHA